MTFPQHIAQQLHQVYFGGNWTAANLSEVLKDVTWLEATHQREGFNSIALLAFHIHYYVAGTLEVLEGRPLTIHDKLSFDMPPLENEEAWQARLSSMWEETRKVCALIEALPEERLREWFEKEKYGTYLRNLLGLTEHAHYHLGQIALLKKLLRHAS